jgi:single-stranded DNA-binding protein
MSAFSLVSGRLHGEPITRPTRTGGQFTAFKLRVTNGNTVEWWSVTTFSETAREELAGLGEGDAVSCVGALGVETYEKNGETRIALRLTAYRVLALKPKPQEAKPQADKAPRAAAAQHRTGPEIAASSWARPATGGALDDEPF